MATPAYAGRALQRLTNRSALRAAFGTASDRLVEETATATRTPNIHVVHPGRASVACWWVALLPPLFVPAQFRPMSHGGQNWPVCFERWPRLRGVSCSSPFRPHRGGNGRKRREGFAGLGSLPLVAERLASPRLQSRFSVTMLRPATSIQINGRFATSRVTFSTVTEPIPRFNASVTSLRSGTTASATKQFSMA